MAIKLLLSIPLWFLFLLSFVPFLAFGSTATQFISAVQKDHSTGQYIMEVYFPTGPNFTRLLVDLGASYSWVNCDNYNSSSYKLIPCFSSLCESTGSNACLGICTDKPGIFCTNNTCLLDPKNPIKPIDYSKSDPTATATVDKFSLPAALHGTSLGAATYFGEDLLFACGHTSYLKGLANGVAGVAALGRSNNSIPVTIGKDHDYTSSFAICLSGSKPNPNVAWPGIAFFGAKGPYMFFPGIDLSKSLVYTPLVLNPVGKDSDLHTKRPSTEYFIKVTSVKVNGKMVALNQSLLAIDNVDGSGGTMISAVIPYTKLESSIYKDVTEAFVKSASSPPFNLETTKPVEPLSVCYPADHVKMNTHTGPVVPTIELVLDRADVVWKIFGSNSMVRITKEKEGIDVWCLGFLDRGVKKQKSISVAGDPSIEIGGHQLEDNLLQFDLEDMRLGFSSSLLPRGTNCTGFKPDIIW